MIQLATVYASVLVAAASLAKAAEVPGRPPSIGQSLPNSTALQKTWSLSDERINYLLAGDACGAIGLKETLDGRKRFGVRGWKKQEQIFRWPVQSSLAGTCQLSLLVSAPTETRLVLQSNAETKELVVNESGWCRIPATLTLGKGADLIQLGLKDGFSGGKDAGVMSIEVITEKFRPVYERQLADLKASRGDCACFQNVGFGLMFQWGNWGYPRTGERKSPWQRIYQEFDIEAFANKMKALNPGYIVWSVTWRGSRFSAPLKLVEQIMGSKDYTLEYDFLGRLADALGKRGIPMFLYYHPGADEPAFWAKMWHGQDNRQPWEDANVAIWTEIGNRLGDKLAGWFIDAGMVQHYPADFYRYKQALRAGNPKRLTTFNPWRFPTVSPYDDMSFGEDKAPGQTKDGVFVNGPTEGLMAHTMRILDGPGWGVFKQNTVIKPPFADTAKLQKMVDDAKKEKHPISFCIMMYEDGTLGEKTEAVLKQLKR